MTPEEEAIYRYIVSLPYNRIGLFEPYVKQYEFFAATKDYDEVALIAANQVGKTHAGGFADAVHLTGLYPDWWPGHRFTKPITAWVAGPNGEKVRDSTQEMLFGPWNKPEDFGTGFLPREAIVGRPSLARGVSGYYDTATIKWCDKNGRIDDSALSTLTFKSYTEGQIAFASSTIDLFHADEEPSLEIYSESLVRLQVKKGIAYSTLTPLLGETDFIQRFDKHGCRISMGIMDAVIGHHPDKPYLGHYTREQAEKKIASFPAHERDARAYGIPMLGEGKVFITPEEQFIVRRQDVPRHWAKIWGLDFGGVGSGSHPFAVVLVAWDKDYDVLYVIASLKTQGVGRLQQIPKIRAIAAVPPVAWPHDGNEKREGPDGTVTLAESYRNPMEGMLGLNMLPTHATWPDGGYSTEAAITELDDRMKTDRFKIFDDQHELLAEIRRYHREKGLIVKKDDDLLSALFKAVMMKRRAVPCLLGDDPGGKALRISHSTAMDIDPFTGAAVPRAGQVEPSTIPGLIDPWTGHAYGV